MWSSLHSVAVNAGVCVPSGLRYPAAVASASSGCVYT